MQSNYITQIETLQRHNKYFVDLLRGTLVCWCTINNNNNILPKSFSKQTLLPCDYQSILGQIGYQSLDKHYYHSKLLFGKYFQKIIFIIEIFMILYCCSILLYIRLNLSLLFVQLKNANFKVSFVYFQIDLSLLFCEEYVHIVFIFKKLSFFWIQQFSYRFYELYNFQMRKLIQKFIFIFIIIFGSNALCSDNCSQCNSNQCTKCAPNFIILNNSCQAYSCTVQHCSVCQVKNLSSCLSCEQGYNLIQNYCNQSISVNVVIIVVMTFVTMILISIALVYLIYYLEKKQNNTNNSLQRSEQKKNQGIILDLEYNLGKTQCTICLTNETDLILTCGHYFHLKCFSDWIMKGKFCPICKSEDLNEIKLVLCMKCKNKCITGTKNDLKKLEGSRISYKCICNERPIVDSNMILLY